MAKLSDAHTVQIFVDSYPVPEVDPEPVKTPMSAFQHGACPISPPSGPVNGFMSPDNITCGSEHGSFHTQRSANFSQYARTRGTSQRGVRQPFIIGVAGGTASGKTTVCDLIMQRLQDQCIVLLSLDSFYRCLEQHEIDNVQSYNFDHPDAFDKPALLNCLMNLKVGRTAEVPIYDFSTHTRSPEKRLVEPADVVILEGILVLHMREVLDQLNARIYVDTDDDVRLARRIQRDVACRGRDVAGVISQYTRFVKPMFEQYIAPSRRNADIIIPWAQGSNIIAIDLITEHIRGKLQQHELRRVFTNLYVMPSNFQTRGLHTITRDATTSKNNFVYYADRLNRLVVEAGLGLLPFTEKTVITPTGHPYIGVAFPKDICGVSIIRSGESMENALRSCCLGINIGKILIHRQLSEDAADVVYEKLPLDIANKYVMLMDPILSTGIPAAKAIKRLLHVGVAEDRIMLLTTVSAPEGITRVCSAFPQVKLVTSEIDAGLDEDMQIMPGVGNFGDRYFCD